MKRDKGLLLALRRAALTSGKANEIIVDAMAEHEAEYWDLTEKTAAAAAAKLEEAARGLRDYLAVSRWRAEEESNAVQAKGEAR